MPNQVSDETITVIRTLFFTRLALVNQELINVHEDIAQEIDVQNHYAVLGLLAEVESRVHAMHTILIVFRECLEG